MIDDVRKQNVMKKLDGIKAPSECAHALAMLKIVLSWALRHHFIDRITCDGLRRSQAHNGMAHERGLGHEEFNAAILAAATEYPFGPIVQLLALTGQRRGEIAALKWEWINQKGKTITLPSHVPKNGLFLRRPATL